MNDLFGDKLNVRPVSVTETSLSDEEEDHSMANEAEEVEEGEQEPKQDKAPEKKRRKYSTAVAADPEL